jgi:hypothetical protein
MKVIMNLTSPDKILTSVLASCKMLLWEFYIFCNSCLDF